MATSPYASFIFEWSIFAVKCTAGILSLIAVLLYTHQDKLLYFPNPPGFPQKPADNPAPFRSPGDWSLNGKKATPQSESIPYEEEHLPTPDGQLIHTWLMLQSNSMNVPTLIYFHGNAGATLNNMTKNHLYNLYLRMHQLQCTSLQEPSSLTTTNF